MLGDFLTRVFMIVLAYAYPAFECYKTVEKNRVEIEQLRFWCQYWIIIALMTVVERFADTFISWLPMYGEAKLGFIIYLWYPKTKGTSYVYQTFLRPYIAKYEKEIDRNILELRTRALDMIALYMHSLITYGQSTFFQMLQYVAAQSTNVRQTKKQEEKSSNPNTPTKQPEKMRNVSTKQTENKTRFPSVHRSISPVLKTELVQEQMPNEVTAQSVECTTNMAEEITVDSSSNAEEPESASPFSVQESDMATPRSVIEHIPTPTATPRSGQESDVAEALRAARTRRLLLILTRIAPRSRSKTFVIVGIIRRLINERQALTGFLT